jgi:hypothetical protein
MATEARLMGAKIDWTEARIAVIRANCAAGLSWGVTAAALGVNRSTLAQFGRQRLGVAPVKAAAAPPDLAVRDILKIPDIPFEPGPRPKTCQWVTSEGAPWIFCDAPVGRADSSFCADHHARVWVAAPSSCGPGAKAAAAF